MIKRSANFFFILMLILSVSFQTCQARGIFGGLGRSLRQVGRDVTNTVRDTTQGIKSDVQDETGIPIAQIEMRDRLAGIKKRIKQIQLAVVKPEVADGAIVFFWNSIGSMDMEDGESLQKVVEYTEGTITDIRKEGISVKKLRRVVEKLERHLMTLSGKRMDLPEGFDFVAAFRLNPVEDSSVDGEQDDYSDSEAVDDGYTDDDAGSNEAEDPVAARYQGC